MFVECEKWKKKWKKLRCLTFGWNVITVTDFSRLQFRLSSGLTMVLLNRCSGVPHNTQGTFSRLSQVTVVSRSVRWQADECIRHVVNALWVGDKLFYQLRVLCKSFTTTPVRSTNTYWVNLVQTLAEDLVWLSKEQLQRSARHVTSSPSSLWRVIRVTLTDWTVTMQCNAMLTLWQCVYQCLLAMLVNWLTLTNLLSL